MSFEVRVGGRLLGSFGDQPAAMTAARQWLLAHPDEAPEVIDTASGQPAAPGATAAERDHLAKKLGF